MQRLRNLFTLLCLLAVSALVISGCGKKQSTTKIGVILPLTGDAAVYGKAMKRGVDLAYGQLPAKERTKYKLIFEDDAFDPKLSVAAANKLISADGVKFIIGGAGSTTAEPITKICRENKVVLLSPFATAPSLSKAGPYFFRIWPSDNYDGQIMAETAYKKLGLRKVAILYVNAAYGKGITDVFASRFRALGGSIVASEGYPQGGTDFRTQLTKIQNAQPDAIFVPGYVNEVTRLMRQARQLGVTTRFLGVNSMYDPNFLKVAGSAAEGAMFTTATYDPKSKAPKIQAFVARFRKAYGNDPDLFAALGYDAFNVTVQAFEKSQLQKGLSVRDALEDTHGFVGPTGEVTFDRNGDVRKPLRLMTVKHGQFMDLDGPSKR